MNDNAGSSASASTQSIKTIAWGLFAFLWLGLFIGSYFWAHKPFDVAIVGQLSLTLAQIGVWLLLLWLAAALGRTLTAVWLANEAILPRMLLQTAVGLGALSLLVWLWGMLGGLRPWLAWLLVIGLALLLRHPMRTIYHELRPLPFPRPQGRFQQLLFLYILLSLGTTFVLALAPETGWDAQVYHLTGPKLFIEQGRIVHPYDLPYLGFPQLGGMQYLLGLLLIGDRVASLLHFAYGLIGIGLTAVLANTLYGRAAAWWATAVLLSVPALFELMDNAYVDATLMAYIMAASYSFLRWQQTEQERWLWLTAVFAGFCGGLKYTAVGMPAAIGLSVLWVSRHQPWPRLGRRALLFGLTAVAVISPWLLENWLSTGNPVYPFVFDHALYWDSWRSWWFDRPGTGMFANAPWRLLAAPFEATILGTTGAIYDATAGPFILILPFLLPLAWPFLPTAVRQQSRFLLFFIALNYLLWLLGLGRSHLLLQTRLLLPYFGLFALLGGAVLANLDRYTQPSLNVGWLMRVLVGGSLALLLFAQLMQFQAIRPWPVLLGLESRDAYLQRTLGVYHQTILAINQLPPDSRVLFMWEPRTYDCVVDCRGDTLLDQLLWRTKRGATAVQIADEWQQQGISHVLLSQRGLDFLIAEGVDPIDADDLAVLANLQATYLQPIEQWGDQYILYAFAP